MGVYEECLKNKELAAKILLPLIEFEFGLIGDDKPTLVQSRRNIKQIEAIFKICQEHGWTTSENFLFKRGNPYFRISVRGFREIYNIAGPFADPDKDRWAQLLLERAGKVGGYKGDKQPTEKKVLEILKRNPNRKWKIEELCLELRLLPSTIRSALRTLEKSHLVRKIRIGKSVFYTFVAG
jgi:DNA-binding transcriptional ArsR family regulator